MPSTVSYRRSFTRTGIAFLLFLLFPASVPTVGAGEPPKSPDPRSATVGNWVLDRRASAQATVDGDGGLFAFEDEQEAVDLELPYFCTISQQFVFKADGSYEWLGEEYDRKTKQPRHGSAGGTWTPIRGSVILSETWERPLGEATRKVHAKPLEETLLRVGAALVWTRALGEEDIVDFVFRREAPPKASPVGTYRLDPEASVWTLLARGDLPTEREDDHLVVVTAMLYLLRLTATEVDLLADGTAKLRLQTDGGSHRRLGKWSLVPKPDPFGDVAITVRWHFRNGQTLEPVLSEDWTYAVSDGGMILRRGSTLDRRLVRR